MRLSPLYNYSSWHNVLAENMRSRFLCDFRVYWSWNRFSICFLSFVQRRCVFITISLSTYSFARCADYYDFFFEIQLIVLQQFSCFNQIQLCYTQNSSPTVGPLFCGIGSFNTASLKLCFSLSPNICLYRSKFCLNNLTLSR